MMRRCSVFAAVGLAMALGAAAGASAQEKIPLLPKTIQPDTSNTLTGCVARGISAGSHTLTDITTDGEAAPKNLARGKGVVLAGTDVDLSKHVGHKVSVTGSYVIHPPASTGTAKPSAASGAKDGKLKTSGTLTVTSLIMLADSCARAANP